MGEQKSWTSWLSWMERRVLTALVNTTAFDSPWPLKGSGTKCMWFDQSSSSAANTHRDGFCLQPPTCPVLPPAHVFIKVEDLCLFYFFIFFSRSGQMTCFCVWSFLQTVCRLRKNVWMNINIISLSTSSLRQRLTYCFSTAQSRFLIPGFLRITAR